MKTPDRGKAIITFIEAHPEGVSASEIMSGIGQGISSATLRRDIVRLVDENILAVKGRNKGARYFLSPARYVFMPIDPDEYFSREKGERGCHESYNFELIDLLSGIRLFTASERDHLETLQQQFRRNVDGITPTQYKHEMSRLAVDLSWKSSQIEGNTYSLLETERLLLEMKTASGKSLEEAKMLLNHKEVLDYIIENPHYLTPLTVTKIENIHSILIRDLDVERNIRTRRVGITGTDYRPLDNEFQIREAMDNICTLVNGRDDVFEKSLFLLVLLSYVQPFDDGNKRTARIVSNAELIANDYCPISFRTVDPLDYKKAMLLFYEQNNLTAFKQIFIEQFEFAVNAYF